MVLRNLTLLLLLFLTVAQSSKVQKRWAGNSVRDLHREYGNIFKFGNRNAASHLWSTFLLERSTSMSKSKLEYMFSGFCAVSGSPVQPSDYNRYGLKLEKVYGTHRFGFLHYCCWPCVCDTQDFIKIDSKSVTTENGRNETFYFAVIGNPCENAEKLDLPFVQPFDGRRTTLAFEAREVRCDRDGNLIGATMSDHGYVIISMFFDSVGISESPDGVVPSVVGGQDQPGRMTKYIPANKDKGEFYYQSEQEYNGMCLHRKDNGYNSGMGEIFRKVAAISPIVPRKRTIIGEDLEVVMRKVSL